MGLADKLDPKDVGRKVPDTMAEIEEYLRQELPFDMEELLKTNKEHVELCSVRSEMKRQGVGKFLAMPLTSLKLLLFQGFVGTLSNRVLAHKDKGRSHSIFARPLWWCVRKAHCFVSYFHYSMCPEMLTLGGTMDLLVAGNPRMGNVLVDVYDEIFGTKGGDALLKGSSDNEKAPRRLSDLEAHLPKMEIDKRPTPVVAGFREDVVELVKCSYYRGQLAHGASRQPQHLGVIMDGNRRYSTTHRGLGSVLAGHQVGGHKLLQVISWAFSAGVKNLTVWALSDDNLKRGPRELNPLFSMMAEYVREIMVGDAPFSIPDVRLRVVGDRSILPEDLDDVIVRAEASTAAHNTKFNLQLAIGYGGRSEITRAVKMAVDAKMALGGGCRQGKQSRVSRRPTSPARRTRRKWDYRISMPY